LRLYGKVFLVFEIVVFAVESRDFYIEEVSDYLLQIYKYIARSFNCNSTIYIVSISSQYYSNLSAWFFSSALYTLIVVDINKLSQLIRDSSRYYRTKKIDLLSRRVRKNSETIYWELAVYNFDKNSEKFQYNLIILQRRLYWNVVYQNYLFILEISIFKSSANFSDCLFRTIICVC